MTLLMLVEVLCRRTNDSDTHNAYRLAKGTVKQHDEFATQKTGAEIGAAGLSAFRLHTLMQQLSPGGASA